MSGLHGGSSPVYYFRVVNRWEGRFSNCSMCTQSVLDGDRSGSFQMHDESDSPTGCTIEIRGHSIDRVLFLYSIVHIICYTFTID